MWLTFFFDFFCSFCVDFLFWFDSKIRYFKNIYFRGACSRLKIRTITMFSTGFQQNNHFSHSPLTDWKASFGASWRQHRKSFVLWQYYIRLTKEQVQVVTICFVWKSHREPSELVLVVKIYKTGTSSSWRHPTIRTVFHFHSSWSLKNLLVLSHQNMWSIFNRVHLPSLA